MNIGQASNKTRLSVKTIRYYEDIQLVTPPRADNGYRDYGDADVHRLAFVQRSRSLGFTIDECRSLLSSYEDKARESFDVKALALEKIEEIDRKLAELKSLREILHKLADHCHGDSRPECPIMDEISKGELI